MGFFNTILDLVFPARCVACDKTGADLCLHCLAQFPPAEKENADWIFSVYDYQDPPLKKALWLFKYSGKKLLAKIFAEIIYEKILEEDAPEFIGDGKFHRSDFNSGFPLAPKNIANAATIKRN